MARASALLQKILVAALLVGAGPAAPAPELWAGRYVLEGEQAVPVFGRVKTRSERLVVATVTRDGAKLQIVEKPCSIRLGDIAGVHLTTDDDQTQTLPPVTITYTARDAEYRAGPWRESIGANGRPTLGVHVEAPLCGGTLQVASDSTSIARGRPRRDKKDGLEGEIRSRVVQSVHEAEGACLRKFAHDTRQELSGRFSFIRVDPGSTCTSLEGHFPLVPSADDAEPPPIARD